MVHHAEDSESGAREVTTEVGARATRPDRQARRPRSLCGAPGLLECSLICAERISALRAVAAHCMRLFIPLSVELDPAAFVARRGGKVGPVDEPAPGVPYVFAVDTHHIAIFDGYFGGLAYIVCYQHRSAIRQLNEEFLVPKSFIVGRQNPHHRRCYRHFGFDLMTSLSRKNLAVLPLSLLCGERAAGRLPLNRLVATLKRQKQAGDGNHGGWETIALAYVLHSNERKELDNCVENRPERQ